MHTLYLNFQNIDVWLLVTWFRSSRWSNRNNREGNYWHRWLRYWIISELNVCNALFSFKLFSFLLAYMKNCDSRRLLLDLDGLWSNTFCDWGLIDSLWSITTDWSASWSCLESAKSFANRPWTYILFNCISIFEIVPKNT